MKKIKFIEENMEAVYDHYEASGEYYYMFESRM